MQVVALRPLRVFWSAHSAAERPIRSWYGQARVGRWRSPADVKREFGTTVDFVADNRAIFDLGGNKFRLVVHISYTFQRVLVKFIGTHSQYDRINPETVG